MLRRLISTSVFAASVMLSAVCGSARSQTLPAPPILPEPAAAPEAPIAPATPAIPESLAIPASPTVLEAPARVASEVKEHEALGVTFQAPASFSEVQTLARKTTGIVYPAGDAQNPRMVVRFAEIASNDGGWVQFSPSEKMTYARYLFLGNNNAPSGQLSRRQFFGQTLTGEAHTIRTRNGYRYIEMYLVSLEKSQRNLAIAFESDTLLSLAKVETAIDTVSESMYELNKAELKELRKQQKKAQKLKKKQQKEASRQ